MFIGRILTLSNWHPLVVSDSQTSQLKVQLVLGLPGSLGQAHPSIKAVQGRQPKPNEEDRLAILPVWDLGGAPQEQHQFPKGRTRSASCSAWTDSAHKMKTWDALETASYQDGPPVPVPPCLWQEKPGGSVTRQRPPTLALAGQAGCLHWVTPGAAQLLLWQRPPGHSCSRFQQNERPSHGSGFWNHRASC